MQKKYVFTVIGAVLLGFPVHAQEPTSLDTITVYGHFPSAYRSRLTNKNMTHHLVQNERDLLKYEVGVTQSEAGRAGANGFAMRGVEADRVAYSIDGVPAAESFSPRFYYIKGFLNGNRNSIDLENVSSIRIEKGADSVIGGNGALGGVVAMQTKTVKDFIPNEDKPFGLYTKAAFDSRNNEFKQVYGGGFDLGKWSGLAQLTMRRSSQFKNYVYRRADDTYGRARGVPDPQHYRSQSVLAKLFYAPTAHHKIGLFFDNLREDRHIEEKSFYLQDHRFTEDTNPYYRVGGTYTYQNNATWIQKMDLRFTHQKVEQIASGEQYFSYIPGWENVVSQTDRRTNTQYLKWIDAKLQIRPLTYYGIEHELVLSTNYARSVFTNYNRDTVWGSPKYTEQVYEIVKPVKSHSYGISLQDNVEFSEKLRAQLGVRYDHYRYKRVASDLRLHNFRRYTVEAPAERRFSAFSYALRLNYQLTPYWQVDYRLGKGFRVPKVEETFFELNSGDNYLPSPNLKPERAISHELSFTREAAFGTITVGLFRTDYRDFIDSYEDVNVTSRTKYNWVTDEDEVVYSGKKAFIYKNVDKAYVQGVELDAYFNGNYIGVDHTFANVKLNYTKGKKNDGTSMLALQPLTATLSLGYQTDRWGVALHSRYVARKKAKEAKIVKSRKYAVDEKTGAVSRGEVVYSNAPFLSRSYVTVDLTAYAKIGKYFQLNIGVFNLFNHKYTTWDNLRQLKVNGAQGDVFNDGRGLGRYTAPGRNFAISLEGRF